MNQQRQPDKFGIAVQEENRDPDQQLSSSSPETPRSIQTKIMRGQVSWLSGHHLLLGLPGIIQWHMETKDSPSTVAGAAPDFPDSLLIPNRGTIWIEM